MLSISLPQFLSVIVFAIFCISRSRGGLDDWTTNESFDQWSGGMPPLNWHFDPGPCLPPEEPDCRGEPYNNCFRWWLPCSFYARGAQQGGDYAEMDCCWSKGSKKTTECRIPKRQIGEFLGSEWYTYCLPLYNPEDEKYDQTSSEERASRGQSRRKNTTSVISRPGGTHGSNQVVNGLANIANAITKKKCKNKKNA